MMRHGITLGVDEIEEGVFDYYCRWPEGEGDHCNKEAVAVNIVEDEGLCLEHLPWAVVTPLDELMVKTQKFWMRWW